MCLIWYNTSNNTAINEWTKGSGVKPVVPVCGKPLITEHHGNCTLLIRILPHRSFSVASGRNPKHIN